MRLAALLHLKESVKVAQVSGQDAFQMLPRRGLSDKDYIFRHSWEYLGIPWED